MRSAAVLGVALLPAIAFAEVTVQTRVGADFEHFGESYRVTDDQDTVTVTNDYGTLIGVALRTAGRSPSRFSVDADVHLGKETRRVRLDFDGRLERGADTFELSHDTAYRVFRDDGEYSISSDHLLETARFVWERALNDRLTLRLQDRFDGTWYADPDEYNLDQWTHEPKLETRLRFHGFDELSVGGRYARRSVPDSVSLGYDRYTFESGLSLLFGWTSAIDISEQLERRKYDLDSARESSWTNRIDARLEFGVGDRATLRLVHESEVVRYDEPDELDFDSNWSRTGFQVEVHRSNAVDLSIMPVYAFLQSDTAPEEEYTETGLEAGVEFRFGARTWISLTDEIGRRDYEVSDPGTVSVGAADTDDLLAELESLDVAFSDYLYNRLTLIVTSDVGAGVNVNLFVNWQPEDHHVNRHDTDTRIITGGIEYAF
ncbi:hypothetical protein K8I85_03910 [bacterium]|nr:hypothetical protein [bacterium]